MAASWETNEALKAANEQVSQGQQNKNQAQVDAGTKAQDAALGDMGIVVYRGNNNNSQTPTSQSTGTGASASGSGAGTTAPGSAGAEPTLSDKVAQLDAQREAKIAANKKKNSNPASSMYVNAAQMKSAAEQQQKQQIDYAVNQGVKELERAEEDAQKQFQTQQNQVDIDEAKALDNQALYAEARGDRGGIGQAQYGQIQATAMTNRRAINTARTELATNTARQITDLRAQGEFQKADAILQLTQNYLSQLNEIQMWEAEYNLTVEQMNEQIRQWNESFAVEVASLTGTYNGQKTRAAREAEAEIALGMLQAGYTLSEEQLANLLSVYNIDSATAETIRVEAQEAKDREKNAGLVNIALAFAQNGDAITEEQYAALEAAGYSREQIDGVIAQAKTAKLANAALSLAQAGIDLSDEQMAALTGTGLYTEAQVKKIISQAKAGNTSSGGGGGGGGGGAKMSLATAKAMAEQGLFTDEVLNVLRGAGFTDEYLLQVYGYGEDAAPGAGGGTGLVDGAFIAAGGGPEAVVVNTHGDSWVYVPGMGRMTWPELANAVAAGKVAERVEGGKHTYVRVR